MSIHIHRVPTELWKSYPFGERWCFVCRKRRTFAKEIHRPTDPMSYYGPHVTVRGECGHVDGDLFPGSYREWEID